MALTHKNVSDILKIVDESDIEELILDIDGAKLVIRRGAAATAATAQPAAAPVAAQPAVAATAPAALPRQSAVPAKPAAAARTDGKLEVRAPMVGTFYRRPSPQDPPFVEVGARVKKGDTLCLIEVMKLYTTLESPRDGTVVEIAAENAALVEHDAVLFVIDPA